MKFETPPQSTDLWPAMTGDGLALLMVLALIVGAALLFLSARRRRTRACRWLRDRTRGGATLSAWRCTACGAEAFTADRRAPKECKRMLRTAPL